jgi:hypothetical protein
MEDRLTLGERRIRVSLSEQREQGSDILKAKQEVARLIDLLHSVEQDHFEQGTLFSERKRLIDKAMESLEVASMWVTKSLS